MRIRTRKRGVFLLAGLVAAGVWLVDELDLAPSPDPNSPAVAAPADANQLLGQLVVAEEDTGAHYKRVQWGERWAVHDGCSTRDLVLLAAAPDATRAPDCDPVCPVHGPPCWTSPYDGRPTSEPGDLEIDHRVALKEANRSRVVDAGGTVGLGAGRVWTPEQKHAFYEDQANLVAATAAVNSGKSDLDAGDWKPGIQQAWCDYATAYARTKVKWRLTVDLAERDGLAQMLATCEGRAPANLP